MTHILKEPIVYKEALYNILCKQYGIDPYVSYFVKKAEGKTEATRALVLKLPSLSTALTAILGGIGGYTLNNLISPDTNKLRQRISQLERIGPTTILTGVGGLSGGVLGSMLGNKLFEDTPTQSARTLGAIMGTMGGAASGNIIGNFMLNT